MQPQNEIFAGRIKGMVVNKNPLTKGKINTNTI